MSRDLSFAPFDVICPQCRGKFHETTVFFNPEQIAQGSMFRLKEPWRGWRWSSFAEVNNGPGDLVCPSCNAMYAPMGRVALDWPEPIKTLDELRDAMMQQLMPEDPAESEYIPPTTGMGPKARALEPKVRGGRVASPPQGTIEHPGKRASDDTAFKDAGAAPKPGAARPAQSKSKFSCPYCRNSFRSKGGLTNHMNRCKSKK